MQHEALLKFIIEQVKHIKGVKAIVLGGSYANNTQRPDSDIDIGLYYTEDQPLDVEAVRAVARTLNDFTDPIVTELGSWGTWVNGGAWLTIQNQRVDFLYRNLNFVAATIDDCLHGKIVSDYWQQPAYGFHSFMYCTETSICQPLYDPEHVIEPLKANVSSYPSQLQRAIVRNFLWSARFTLDNMRKPAKRGEVYMTIGGLARTIHCLVQVLYALNKVYYLSEKRLAADMATFSIKPVDFLERITVLLGATGTTSDQLQKSIADAEELYRQVDRLGNDILNQAE
ncbi:nucleotidyltransferase domain-containing protein [Dictyobacter formicarum]|uniref:Polymerase nucleotidyl transferase domain-containing protein n=1 Tax=Dictyobacter formicarum TaxID=2778368 RepID=A0ABQ3VJP8_9CHLR|nr:nucleotidyltransferase domain-containing protein [Dictyobacter formicarum]GHO86402.1 hypothetical protein KSZ_44080 [Dictyobacter formicarum]